MNRGENIIEIIAEVVAMISYEPLWRTMKAKEMRRIS